MKKGKLKNTLIIILSLLIVGTIAFIWGNSIPGKTESAEQSEGVYQTVKPTLDDTFGEDAITHHDFRKLAHFGEFFLLGAEISLLLLVIKKYTYKSAIISATGGLAVGVIDEIIQIFSKRGATFLDVLLDFSGVVLATLTIYLTVKIIEKTKRKKLLKENL